MMGFLYGVAFAVEFALGTLILVGVFKDVWETAAKSKGLFWALGWSAYAMSFCSFLKAMGDVSQAFEIVTGTVQILFHTFVLSYVAIYMIDHWSDDNASQ